MAGLSNVNLIVQRTYSRWCEN